MVRTAAPRRRTRSAADADRLGLQVGVEALDPVLAADPGALVAAERGVGAVPDAAVDGHRPGPDLPRDRHGAVLAGRRHPAGEPVPAIVGDPDRVRVVL